MIWYKRAQSFNITGKNAVTNLANWILLPQVHAAVAAVASLCGVLLQDKNNMSFDFYCFLKYEATVVT